MIGPRLLSLATATAALTPGQVKLIGGMLDAIDRQNARRTALEAATAILDPNRELSLTARARLIQAALALFKRYKRIVRNGYRYPDLESACAVLLACGGAEGWRRLYDELRRLSYQ